MVINDCFGLISLCVGCLDLRHYPNRAAVNMRLRSPSYLRRRRVSESQGLSKQYSASSSRQKTVLGIRASYETRGFGDWDVLGGCFSTSFHHGAQEKLWQLSSGCARPRISARSCAGTAASRLSELPLALAPVQGCFVSRQPHVPFKIHQNAIKK